VWLAKAIAPSARAFLLKSCSSLRRCTARAPDRSGWSVCRVCSPHRPSALLRVHTLNFTSQPTHQKTSRAVLETCPVRPSYGRSTSRIGRSECLYEEIYLPFGSGAQETGCTSLQGRRGAAPAQTPRRPWHPPLLAFRGFPRTHRSRGRSGRRGVGRARSARCPSCPRCHASQHCSRSTHFLVAGDAVAASAQLRAKWDQRPDKIRGDTFKMDFLGPRKLLLALGGGYRHCIAGARALRRCGVPRRPP
jgi:hypothetical protein